MCELQLQEQAAAAKIISKEYQDLHSKKLIAPQILDQFEGDKVCGPDQRDKSYKETRIVGLIETISSQ